MLLHTAASTHRSIFTEQQPSDVEPFTQMAFAHGLFVTGQPLQIGAFTQGNLYTEQPLHTVQTGSDTVQTCSDTAQTGSDTVQTGSDTAQTQIFSLYPPASLDKTGLGKSEAVSGTHLV